jgi:hypothetical protein
MAWFPEKSSIQQERLTQEKRLIEIRLRGLDVALNEIEELRRADKQLKEWLSSGLHAPD